MISLYFRSSSLGNWEFCQMQYYLVYNLGYQTPTQKKALLGTIVHKTLEILANFKLLAQQKDKKKYSYNDKETGPYTFTQSELLSEKLVDEILLRSYKYYTENTTYLTYAKADYKFCEDMVDACLYQYGSQFDPRTQNIVAPEQSFDLEINEPWARIEHGGEVKQLRIKGTMDLVTSPEEGVIEYVDYKGLALDTPIYSRNGWTTMGALKVGDIIYDMHHRATRVIGKSEVKNLPCYKISFLSTKGEEEHIICDNEHLWIMINGEVKVVTELKSGDLIPYCGHEYKEHWIILDVVEIQSVPTQCISVDSHTETFLCGRNKIPTHNTGARKNWATDEEKTYAKLHDDIQLLLYFYALRKLYPNYKSIIMTIFFLRDGGPFSLCFDETDEKRFLKKLEEKFVEIKNCKDPKPIDKWRSSFKCQKICHFYKTKWPGTDKTMCHHAEETIKLYGIENATSQLRKPGFSVDFYSAPGALQKGDDNANSRKK